MLVKVLIYAYATRVFSSRGIARKPEEDVTFRRLAAGNFPQHRTICKFRRRHLSHPQVRNPKRTSGQKSTTTYTSLSGPESSRSTEPNSEDLRTPCFRQWAAISSREMGNRELIAPLSRTSIAQTAGRTPDPGRVGLCCWSAAASSLTGLHTRCAETGAAGRLDSGQPRGCLVDSGGHGLRLRQLVRTVVVLPQPSQQFNQDTHLRLCRNLVRYPAGYAQNPPLLRRK